MHVKIRVFLCFENHPILTILLHSLSKKHYNIVLSLLIHKNILLRLDRNEVALQKVTLSGKTNDSFYTAHWKSEQKSSFTP